MVGLAVEVLKTWGKEMEPIAEKLTALAPTLVTKLFKIYSANPAGQGYNVLCHGDFHLRNLLFKWADQEAPEQCAEAIQFVRTVERVGGS